MKLRRASILVLAPLAVVATLGWYVTSGRATGEQVGVVPTTRIATERGLDEGGTRVEVAPEPEPATAAEVTLPAEEQPSQIRQLRVRVLDGETGAPVHEAGVYAESDSPRMEPHRVLVMGTIGYAEQPEDFAQREPYFVDADEEFRRSGDGITDPDGVAVVELKEPFPWIRVRKGERFGMARCPERSDSVTILLKPLEQLEIEVVDGLGRPAEGVLVVEGHHTNGSFTDRSGRVSLPVIATRAADAAEALAFVLPLADSSPKSHLLNSGESPSGPLRFVLGRTGTLELMATSDGTRIEAFDLEFRMDLDVHVGDDLETRVWFEQQSDTGSILIPHVSPGRTLHCKVFESVPFPELVFPRVELDSTEPGRAVTVREIPLRRGLVRFRGVSVDEGGAPLRKAWVNAETDAVVNGQMRPDYLVLDGDYANDAGEFDILEFWDDHGPLPDWEPGSSFDFEATCGGVLHLATVRTPPWTSHARVSRLRRLDFGTVVFRRAP